MSVIRFKLSAMMFLEFFIWGAWYPFVFGYLPSLGYSGNKPPAVLAPIIPQAIEGYFSEQALILIVFNVAALVALFFSTQFADRNFAAEKFLAFSQLVGGVAILALFWIRKPDPETPAPFWPFFLLLLVHSLFYVPTISITNSIAFANVRDPQKEFGPVRLWGTIGWIAAAWPFVFILVDWAKVPAFGSVGVVDWLRAALNPDNAKSGEAFRQATGYTFVAAGGASLLLALFSLFLPHTPPKPASAGGERLAWLEAMKLLKHPFVLVLFVVTFIDAAVHQYFFVWTERYLTGAPSETINTGVGIASNWVMPVMSIGQIAEIGTMAFLSYVLTRLGWRTTMVIGILGHAARFAAFAFVPNPWLAVLVNVLHGICYAFFFATVYIFVDEFFPKDARSSAQGLFNALILGLGPIVTNIVSPKLGTMFAVGKDAYDFRQLFTVPLVAALVAAALLLLFFRPPRSNELAKEPPPRAFDEGGVKGAGLLGGSEQITTPGKVTTGH
jgi:nucleoside transporter